MTERIITAMDYHIDSFTKAIPKPLKPRMLGDIDGKYNITDPLLEVSYQTFPDPSRKLDDRTEKTIHQPLAGTVFRGIEEDLERLIRSPERARSSTAPHRNARLNSPSSRPLTSVSQASGRSSAMRRRLGNLPDSLSKFSPHASVKRLAFTSPTIKVGVVDVRDEVTDEIVNKPMTLRWGNLKAQSAPPGGRARSGGLRSSSGARSAKWTSASSSRRAKTSYSKRRRLRVQSSEKIPGPFMTVKVPERDVWVVSNSTPTTFFDERDTTVRQINGTKSTVKFANWENTAESVPKEEQSSPPRHERVLGAPAQFSPTIKWLRYDHSAPPKKPPVLTPFKDTLDGRYYHLETEQCKKVNHHITASPGVRIARNGEVVSCSMKLESLGDEEDTSGGSESESDADVSSLIPAKLAAKIKQHYGTPEDESGSDYEEESGDEVTDYEEEEGMGRESSRNEIIKSSTETGNSDKATEVNTGTVASETTTPPETDHDEIKDVDHHNTDDTDVSSMSDDESVESADHEHLELTKDSIELLDRITSHNQPNPFIDSSDHTSSTSYDSHEMEGYLDSLGVKVDFHQAGNDFDKESDVWRVLENVNPTFWISQSRHKKLALLRRLRKQREADHNARFSKEFAASAKTKSDVSEEVIIPLCWEDELVKADKIVKGRDGTPNINQKCDSSALPVVYHKGKRNLLPTATVASTMKQPVIMEKAKPARSSQSVNFNINISRGYKVPMSTPRSLRSDRTISANNSRQTSASSSRERKIMDLAELLQLTPDSLPSKTSPVKPFTHNIKKDQVTIVLKTATDESDKNRGSESKRDATHASQNKTDSGLNGIENEMAQQAVESLDFTRLDVDSAGDSNLQSSQRFSDLKSNELASPQNTPTTPFSHHHSVNGFVPRSQTAGQISDSKRIGDREANIDHPSSMASRPMSVFAYDEPKGFGNKLQVKSPIRGAANADHNDNRPKASRMPSLHSSAGSKLLKTTNKLNLSNDFTETNFIVPTVQLRAPNSPNVLPMKTADFIQITQSLHIRDRTVMESDRSSLTGNKMYDSYMHELAAQSSERRDEPIDDRGVVGRGLGGNSGKGGIPPLPRSVRKNLASCQTNQAIQSPNITPFTPQAGRRSGLTMVPQDGSRRIGPFGLGVKGDQVRLNIDKNIHNIYRDLGVLKSPERPHISSAKSAHSSQKDDITVTIPSVPPSERDAKIDSPRSDEAQEAAREINAEAKSNTRPSSSNPSVAVQDSGTQWSSRSVKPGDETQQGFSLHGHRINGFSNPVKIDQNEQLEKEPTPANPESAEHNNENVEEKPTIEIAEYEQNTATTAESLSAKLEVSSKLVNGVNAADEASDDGQSEDNDVRGVTMVTVNMQPE